MRRILPLLFFLPAFLHGEILGIITEPGGSDSYVQYNSSGVFQGDGDFTFNGTTATITGVSAGAISSVTGTFSGDVSALGMTLTNGINSATGTFSGPVSFESTVTIKGPIPFIDVTAWGLVGDDSTDNLSLATTMFEACPPGGAIYFFPAGIYKFTNTPTIPANQDNITIMGAGPETSIWKFYHPTSNPNGITFSDAENITIKDIGVDGSNIVMDTQRNAITFAGTIFGVKHGLIDNVHILNWQGGGILLNTCTDVTVRNSYIYRQYEHGIYAAGSNHCKIINNTFDESAYGVGGSNAAIKVATFSDSLIQGNHFYHPLGTPIIVQYGADRTKIQDNHFDIINDVIGVSIAQGEKDIDVSGNLFYFSGSGSGKAIYLGPDGIHTDMRFTGNDVISADGATAFDLSVTTLTASVITGNRIRAGGSGVAIALGGLSSGNIITGNKISDYSTGTGIQLGAGTSGNEVHSNSFTSNVAAPVDDGAGNNTVIVDVSATVSNVYFKNTKASGQGDMFVHAIKASNGNSGGFKIGTGETEKWAIATGLSAVDEVLKVRDLTNGVNVAAFTQNGGLQIGSPTGGDKGAGTINAAGTVYVNNVSLASTASPTFTGTVGLPAVTIAGLTSSGSGGALTLGAAGSEVSFNVVNSTGSGQGDAFYTVKKAATGNSAGLRMYTGSTEWWQIGTGFAEVTDKFRIRNAQSGVSEVIISTDDHVYIPPAYTDTDASAANVFIDSSGHLFRSTSGLKYKDGIQPYTTGLDGVLSLNPVTFYGKTDKKKLRHVGFIAEEVEEAGLKEFVMHDEDGKPDALEYSRLTALLVNAIKELNDRISELEKKNVK